jgi:hypothetical protein
MAEESKTRETLRYLGYTFGVVGGMILVGLLYLILAPFMNIIMLLTIIAGIVFFIVLALAAIFYLFIDRNKK